MTQRAIYLGCAQTAAVATTTDSLFVAMCALLMAVLLVWFAMASLLKPNL